MKLIIFQKTEIKSKKDGREWVKLSGLLNDGSAYELFTSKDEYEKLAIPTHAFLSGSDVKKIFSDYDSVEVEFNSLGRLNSVS